MRTRSRYSWIATILLLLFFNKGSVYAQQRPFLTEDPRTIPDASVVAEIGIGFERDALFTLSGLRGNLLRVGQTGLSFGLGDRAEFQMSGTIHDYLRTPDGAWHQDFGDLALSTKLVLLKESRTTPVISFRPTVILPNANQASGLGLNTTRFFGTVLAGKSFGNAFVFGNVGFGIIDDPIRVAEQNDVLTEGLAAIVSVAKSVRLGVEFNGTKNPRHNPTPGSETGAQARWGVQLGQEGMRWDIGFLAGLTGPNPQFGVVAGLTKTFNLRRK